MTFADGNRATFVVHVNGTSQAKAVDAARCSGAGNRRHSPPPPLTTADAWRLLNQATFGASQAEAARGLNALGIAGWINDQFDQPVSGYPDTYNRIQLTTSVDCETQTRPARTTGRLAPRASARATT